MGRSGRWLLATLKIHKEESKWKFIARVIFLRFCCFFCLLILREKILHEIRVDNHNQQSNYHRFPARKNHLKGSLPLINKMTISLSIQRWNLCQDKFSWNLSGLKLPRFVENIQLFYEVVKIFLILYGRWFTRIWEAFGSLIHSCSWWSTIEVSLPTEKTLFP